MHYNHLYCLVSLASVVEIFEEPQKDMLRCGRASHSTSVRAGVEGQVGTIMHAVSDHGIHWFNHHS